MATFAGEADLIECLTVWSAWISRRCSCGSRSGRAAGVVGSSVARDFLGLLELLEAERTDPDAVAMVFGRSWEELAREDEPLLPDAWQSHLVGRILDDENPFRP